MENQFLAVRQRKLQQRIPAYRADVPYVDGTPLARTIWLVSQSWSVAPMCSAFLLGANTDGLHAIRKISSRSKARARGALGQLGFADLGGRPFTA